MIQASEVDSIESQARMAAIEKKSSNAVAPTFREHLKRPL